MIKVLLSMSPKSTSSKSAFSGLLETLDRLNFWLERETEPRIIVAHPTIKELKAQGLPEHVQVIPKKRRGKRKALRGRRHYGEQYSKLAVWPKDSLEENVLPFATCCISGEVDYNIADYVLKSKAGDWVVFPAGIPKQDGSKSHLEGDPAGRMGEVLWFSPTLGGLSCWACRSEGADHFYLKNFNCQIDNAFLSQMFIGFCEEMQTLRRREISQKLLSLILLMLRSQIRAGDVSKGISGLRFIKDDAQNDPISEALIYIDDNLHQHLTINKVARHVLVSPATFTRHFKEKTGDTFQEYKSKRRMKAAEQLLKTTNLPIVNVCTRVGLNYGQIRLLFQRKHGCSPGEYRELEN